MKTFKFIFISLFALSLFYSASAQEVTYSYTVSEKGEDSLVTRQTAEVKLYNRFTKAIYDELIYKNLYRSADLLLPANKDKISDIIRKYLTLEIKENRTKNKCTLKGEYTTDIKLLAEKIEGEFFNPLPVHGKAAIQFHTTPAKEEAPAPQETIVSKVLTPEEAKEAENYFTKALEYHDLGLYDKAIESYKKGIEIQKSLPEPYFNLGNAYYGLENYKEAIESYQQAINLKKDYPDAYFNLGNAFLDVEDYQQAIEAYEITLKYAPKEAGAYYNLGVVYFELGDHQLAVSSLQKAAQLGSRDAQIFLSANNISW